MHNKALGVVNLQSVRSILTTGCNQEYWTFDYFIAILQTLDNNQPAYFPFSRFSRQKWSQETQWTIWFIRIDHLCCLRLNHCLVPCYIFCPTQFVSWVRLFYKFSTKNKTKSIIILKMFSFQFETHLPTMENESTLERNHF